MFHLVDAPGAEVLTPNRAAIRDAAHNANPANNNACHMDKSVVVSDEITAVNAGDSAAFAATLNPKAASKTSSLRMI
ncbi:MAG: hypothetical protein Q7T10_01900 [Rhodoferax sp.]|uniref:hypothetical protein n=1 Tax=Rhodoferax sp. TaxID=50421 RepID=UPI0027214FC6|nr:hypothetical protein [Rhodoferax sp.]MDO8447543.1 hypothetical protein [Rhodoferax sp.]